MININADRTGKGTRVIVDGKDVTSAITAIDVRIRPDEFIEVKLVAMAGRVDVAALNKNTEITLKGTDVEYLHRALTAVREQAERYEPNTSEFDPIIETIEGLIKEAQS